MTTNSLAACMRGRICLIVDDDSAIRGYLRAMLRHQGFENLEAGNAVEALEILQGLGGEIDLLITDIEMRGNTDGIDLAKSVRNSFSTLRIIAVPGRIDKTRRDSLSSRSRSCRTQYWKPSTRQCAQHDAPRSGKASRLSADSRGERSAGRCVAELPCTSEGHSRFARSR
jgi:CheY-like chemotaxis protein